METAIGFVRKATLAAAAAVAALLAVPLAMAQDYPSKPIRLVIPGPPGGGTDILGRMVAEGIAKQLGQPVIPDNKPGASGMLGAEVVLRAPADGYTLYMAFSATLTSNQWLYKKISYDPLKDFVPIAPFAQVPNVLLVHPAVPAKTVAEFIALAKAEPGKLNYASSYPGSMSHLSMEMLKQMSGTNLLHIPYNGDAPSMNALVGGQVQVMITNTVNSLQMIKAGRLVPLGVTSAARAAILPDVPTIAESGLPGFETTLWYGVAAAAGTPAAIVEKLNQAIRAAQATPEIKARLAVSGSEAMVMSSAEFAALIRRDAKKAGDIVKSANITVE